MLLYEKKCISITDYNPGGGGGKGGKQGVCTSKFTELCQQTELKLWLNDNDTLLSLGQ